MATTTEQKKGLSDRFNSEGIQRPIPPKKRGSSFLLTLVMLGAVVGAVFFFVPDAWPSLRSYVASMMNLDTKVEVLTHEVTKSKLIVTVTEDGNVESASNVDVKCQIGGGGTILWIVEDGKQVEKGEVVVRLDQSNIEDQLNSQRITYEKALATKIQTEEEFETAKISVREYEEGTYLKEVQDLDAQITIAMENLRSAENMLEFTQRMVRKGFVTRLQLEADQFSVKRAQLEVKSANTAKTVLQEFTKAKMLKQLESAREASGAKARADQAAFNLEKARLERLRKQLENCVVKAPQSGMAVWANRASGGKRGGGQSGPSIEEGAVVREGQDILKIPDLSQMQVKVTVHETQVDKLRRGMPARIVIQDKELKGAVVSVASQPEPSSFFTSNVKEYATIVKILSKSTDLRPGLTAYVEILVEELDDVVAVPVHVVIEQRGKFYCWVQSSDGPQKREVVLGSTNNKLIELKDGLLPGEKVVLNPRVIVAEELAHSSGDEPTEEIDTEERFGIGELAETGDEQGNSRSGSQRGGAGGDSGRPGGSGGGGGGNAMRSDANGDGRISREEAPDKLKESFDRIDTNGDGFIDASELSARRKNREGGGGGGGQRGGGVGRGRDATGTSE